MFPMINIGPLAIQSGGLILLLSIWIGIWISDRFSKNLGTSSDNIENSILIALLIGIVSARIGFFLRNFNIFLENPLSIFSLSPSMLYVPFGILIGTLSGLIYAQKKGLPNLPTLDTLSPMLLIVFIGFQLANFATGNIYGLPSNLPWAVPLWGAMRHPVQIYAIILALGAFLILVILTKGLKKSGFMRSGILFKLTITTLAIITIFSRAFVDNKALLAGVDTYQLFGFGILLVGLIQLNKLCYQPRKHIGVLISMGANQNPKPNLALALKRLQS
ncbi:MAG: prolipoprotein diacylglyceryl transferase, partial [Anaerolineales bacterium]